VRASRWTERERKFNLLVQVVASASLSTSVSVCMSVFVSVPVPAFVSMWIQRQSLCRMRSSYFVCPDYVYIYKIFVYVYRCVYTYAYIIYVCMYICYVYVHICMYHIYVFVYVLCVPIIVDFVTNNYVYGKQMTTHEIIISVIIRVFSCERHPIIRI